MVFDNEITAYKNCYRHLDISQVDAVISDLEASLKDFESFKGKTVVDYTIRAFIFEIRQAINNMREIRSKCGI